VIAIRTEVSDDELRQAGADWIVNSCAEISLTGTNNGLELKIAV